MKKTYEVTNDRRVQLKGPRRPSKPENKAWSHQSHLTAGVGNKIVVHLNGGGGKLVGELKAVDNFTIQLLVSYENQKYEMVLFKSSIESYYFKG